MKKIRLLMLLAFILLLITLYRPAFAAITFTSDVTSIPVGGTVNFTVTSDCPVIFIGFGDGVVGSNLGPGTFNVPHTYTAAGTYIAQIGTDSNPCATANVPPPSQIIINVGGAGPAPVTPGYSNITIYTMSLHFKNRKPEIQVKQNQLDLVVYMKLSTRGKGLLQGYWEIDGKIWSYVNKHIPFNAYPILTSPELPTSEPGLHKVRFVVTRPGTTFTLPTAIYYVGPKPGQYNEYIELTRPFNHRLQYRKNGTYRWRGADFAHHFEIIFYPDDSDEPFFKAITRTSYYTMDAQILGSFFRPGKAFQWQVRAYDVNNNIMGQSIKKRQFFDVVSHQFTPSHIVVVTPFDMQGNVTINRIKSKYKLTYVSSFRLTSLSAQGTIFKTGQPVLGLVKLISKEEGVILAQPNYLLHSYTDALSKYQKVHSLLNLDKVHSKTQGLGVRVAIIDTGVDTLHPDLKDQVVTKKNFVRESSYRPEIHGTAVAGVIAARRDEEGMVGIAPQARIISLRACHQPDEDDMKAICESTAVVQSIDAALADKVPIINMSVGTDTDVPLLAMIVELAVKKGVLIVAPVGNAKQQVQPSYPARYAGVISVGGYDDNKHAYPSEALVEQSKVVAPATQIFTTIPNGKHNFLDGTSMSSAVVSGLLALALQQRLPKNVRDYSSSSGGGIGVDLPDKQTDLCQWGSSLLKQSFCP